MNLPTYDAEVRELLDAKAEGRVVLLPKLNKGKTLYWVWDGKIVRMRYKGINGGCVDKKGVFHVYCEMVLLYDVLIGKYLIKKGDKRYFYADDLDIEGVYTTRASAQKALGIQKPEKRSRANSTEKKENDIGKMALLGDVWCQIMDVREEKGKKEYSLYSKSDWIPESWIKDIKPKTWFKN